jgi:hypothetical protein
MCFENKERHKKVSFEEEYRQYLIENDFDDRYFLNDKFCPALQAVAVWDS